jgi:hypothetical protein
MWLGSFLLLSWAPALPTRTQTRPKTTTKTKAKTCTRTRTRTRWAPALASLTPLIGGALGSLVGAGVALLSLGGALSASLLLVAAAWLRFRPLHSALLAAAAAALATAHTALMRQHLAASSVSLPPRMASRSV